MSFTLRNVPSTLMFKGVDAKTSKTGHAPKFQKRSKSAAEFKTAIQPHLKNCRTLFSRRKTLLEKKTAIPTAGWFDSKSTDVNSLIQKELDLIDSELKMVRGTVRGMMKSFNQQHFKIILRDTFTNNTSAAGVLQTVGTVDVSANPEWALLANLFDEFRVTGGTSHFTATPICDDNKDHVPWVVFAYDPADNGVIPSLADGRDIEQSLLVSTAVVAVGFNTFSKVVTTHHQLHWKVPSDVLLNVVSGNAVVNGTWQPTQNGTPSPYGWMKSYGSTFQASVHIGLTECRDTFVEFRCRQ